MTASASSQTLSTAPAGTVFSFACEQRTWQVKRVRVLGKGSFGSAILVEHVNRAHDEPAHIVIKEVNLQVCTTEQVRHIKEEVKVMKRCVKHPNIVRYLDSNLNGPQTAFIVMEYCDDGDLAGLLERAQRKRQPIAEPQVLSILVQVLVALKFLHCDSCIIHRDLKPGNIFLMSSGVVKLGDFGVSVALQQSADVAKTFCGTPYYLAPEVCREQPYNGKADVWSLGVILYQLLAEGARPFTGATLLMLLQNISGGKYEPLPTTSGYSVELMELVPQMLAVDPNLRPGVKRLLHTPYILDAPQHCSLPTLGHPYYKALFPTVEAVKPSAGLDQAALDELEAFATDSKTALMDMESQFGMKACRDEGMTARQRREMFGVASAPKASPKTSGQPANPSNVTSTPSVISSQPQTATVERTYSDESFEYDEDFEDDIDACGPTMAPSAAVFMNDEDFIKHSTSI